MSHRRTEIAALRYARGRIAQGWTQGTLFRGADGGACTLREATCYCLSGALVAAFHRTCGVLEHWDLTHLVGRQLIPDAPGPPPPPVQDVLVAWNDWRGRTQDDVLALLDRTIAAAERQDEIERERARGGQP